jgi:hypothetical protein
MERTPVTSSNLKSVGYDPQTQTLEIEFTSGAVYQYVNVPPEIHQALIKADSLGRYFNDNIKENYSYRRMS